MNESELLALAHRCGLSTQLRLLAAADLQRANLTVDEALAVVNWTLLEFGKAVWEKAQKEQTH